VRTALIVVVVLYAAFAAFAWFASDRMIFLPPAPSYGSARLPIALIPGENGASIATLYLPNPDAQITLVYSHGNAEDLGQVAPLLEEFRRAGFAVLAFDYRGYGASTGGPPSAHGATRDMEAVYRHAVGTLGIPPSRIVLVGRSVGSGPATELAARYPVGGLVIESGFVSAFRVMTHVPLLPFDRFHNLRHVRSVRCPVLVIHGREDEVIPWSHGRRLFEAAHEPKSALWVDGAHHNDLALVAGPRYWAALRAFGRTVATRAIATP
jgi:fermentation-respiration switch protein FrsA (DUF1100 family)